MNKNSTNNFGYTLVRRHPVHKYKNQIFRNSWYEYFTLDGKIPFFKITNLDLGLWENKKFEFGSIVKLYSYQLPKGSRSDITLDLWRDLNHYLYHPALPILLYENRNFAGKSPSKLMLGNKTRLIIDERVKKKKQLAYRFLLRELEL